MSSHPYAMKSPASDTTVASPASVNAGEVFPMAPENTQGLCLRRIASFPFAIVTVYIFLPALIGEQS